MSKERLEEIEAKYSTLTVSSERDGTEYTEVDVEDLVFLIQNGFKQTERVQGLEEQNKRYREALEFYSDIELYDEYDHPELGLTTDVNIDKGKKARKALEG